METIPQTPFSFSINVAGVTPVIGARKIPTGYYIGVIKSNEIKTSPNGRAAIQFKVEISQGTYMGMIRTTSFSIPEGDTDKVRPFWRTLLESVGFSSADLDAGAITIDQNTFPGKTVYFKYIAKDEENGIKYDAVEFRTPRAWEDQKRQEEMSAAAVAQETARAASLPSPAAGSLTAPAVVVAPLMGQGATQAPSNGSPDLMAQLAGLGIPGLTPNA